MIATTKVIVTRPRKQADALAERIRTLGREVVVLPLVEIHPLSDPQPLVTALNNLSSYALVIFISPNAIDATFNYLKQWPNTPIAVIGTGSQIALATYQVQAPVICPPDSTQADSQALFKSLDLPALSGRKVLIIRGDHGREWLADELATAGVHITQVAAYRRSTPALSQEWCAQLLALLDSQHEWVITSSEAMRFLARTISEIAPIDGVAKMQRQRIIVPYARIAHTAQELGFENVVCTGTGDAGLFAALQSRS